jgi:hypothetical protein
MVVAQLLDPYPWTMAAPWNRTYVPNTVAELMATMPAGWNLNAKPINPLTLIALQADINIIAADDWKVIQNIQISSNLSVFHVDFSLDQTTTLNGTGGAFTEDAVKTQKAFANYWTNYTLSWRDNAPVDWAAMGPLNLIQAMEILFNGTASQWNGYSTLTADDILAMPEFSYRLNVDVEYEWLAAAENLDFQIFDSDIDYGGVPTGGQNANWYFPDGYDEIGEYLLYNGTGGAVRYWLNKPVVTVDYSQRQMCRVTTSDGTVYTADVCVSALPPGVLKFARPKMIPEWPTYLNESFSKIGTGGSPVGQVAAGSMQRLSLRFTSSWWTVYNIAHGLYFGRFAGVNNYTRGNWSYFIDLSVSRPSVPVLGVLCVGLACGQKQLMTEAQLWAEVREMLARAFGRPEYSIPTPINIHFTRWDTDPYAYGSGTYAQPGCKNDDFTKTSIPLFTSEQPNYAKLFFSGDHGNWRYRNSVHGAVVEGIRTSNSMLANASKVFPTPFWRRTNMTFMSTMIYTDAHPVLQFQLMHLLVNGSFINVSFSGGVTFTPNVTRVAASNLGGIPELFIYNSSMVCIRLDYGIPQYYTVNLVLSGVNLTGAVGSSVATSSILTWDNYKISLDDGAVDFDGPSNAIIITRDQPYMLPTLPVGAISAGIDVSLRMTVSLTQASQPSYQQTLIDAMAAQLSINASMLSIAKVLPSSVSGKTLINMIVVGQYAVHIFHAFRVHPDSLISDLCCCSTVFSQRTLSLHNTTPSPTVRCFSS